MTLTEKLQAAVAEASRKAAIEHFESVNRAIKAYDADYRDAVKFVEQFAPAQIERSILALEHSGFQGEARALFEAAQASRQAEVAERFKDKHLVVEVLHNYAAPGRTEFLVPVQADDGTRLEKDLSNRVIQAALLTDPQVKHGRLGPYMALSLGIGDLAGARARLESPCEPFRLAHVGLHIEEAALPLLGAYPDAGRSIVKAVRHSYLEYGLITTYKSDGRFFPPLDQEFELVTPAGSTTCHVTSKIRGGRGRGSYIVGSLKAIFCAMKLQVGDSIEITELARHARYSLKKAK